MNCLDRFRWIRLAGPMLLMAASAGCGTGNARFVTDSDVARTSLEAVLSAWRDGRPYGTIESSTPVRAADSLWQGGQRIESYQVGDEEAEVDGTRRFPVTLKLKGQKEPKQLRYVVHGRDPVWVFSEADYQRMIDMGNGKETPRTGKTGLRRGRR